jgi:hypothetical protein
VLTFKHKSDWQRWRDGFGHSPTAAPVHSLPARDWITRFNAISELWGKSAVVTSWFRYDNTAHNGGEAVDFRVHHYDPDELRDIAATAVDKGIPVVLIQPGDDRSGPHGRSPSAHFHCGEIATLAYERDD